MTAKIRSAKLFLPVEGSWLIWPRKWPALVEAYSETLKAYLETPERTSSCHPGIWKDVHWDPNSNFPEWSRGNRIFRWFATVAPTGSCLLKTRFSAKMFPRLRPEFRILNCRKSHKTQVGMWKRSTRPQPLGCGRSAARSIHNFRGQKGRACRSGWWKMM